MEKILITGSTDGLGELAAKKLIHDGHEVVLHARNEKRASEILQKLPKAKGCVVGDLGNQEETKKLAKKINEKGQFTSIIHNAGVYNAAESDILNVNVLSPYILTALIDQPKRLIYLSSGMHLQGHINLNAISNNSSNYADSKLYILMLCKAIARRWPSVYANAVDPGWVPTKMGGENAPDDLQKGYETQCWLSVSHEPQAEVSGRYFFHKHETRYNKEADDVTKQDELLKLCAKMTGIEIS